VDVELCGHASSFQFSVFGFQWGKTADASFDFHCWTLKIEN